MEKEEIKQYAQEVAEKLGEKDDKPIQQIELIVEHMGKEFVDTQLQKTEDIETNGGMKTEDKSRRRTKGGVFFYIAKAEIPPDIRSLIFPNYGQGAKGKVIEWTERAKEIQPLLDEGEHGEMQFVKMYIQGRPGKIHILDNSVMTTIAHEQKRSPMPRGVPHPPEQAQIYVVYMGIKQWEPVKPYLDKYKTDKLMIEGTIVWDEDLKAFAVFAESVTSKRLEKAKRQEARENTKAELEQAEKEIAKPQSKDDDEERSTEFEIDVPVPDGAPPEVAKKLKQLHNAAATLRHKIKTMEDEGKKSGIGMTKRLLQNTEKQIAQLEKQYT